jgi:transcriptional regulator with XRE-family HTH domain
MSQGPTVRRLQLGRELRRYREGANVTREAAAARMSRDYTWLSRAEGGKLPPSVAEVEMLLNFYCIASDSEECQRILEIAREARKRSTLRVPEAMRAYIGLEAEAVEIRQFGIDLVPGLLQTEEYTRAVATAIDPAREPAGVEQLVKLRRERQARLTGDDPLQLWVVMDEAAIRRIVGGPDVMRGQLDRLLTLGKLSNVSIRIVPTEAGAHAAMGAPFSLLRLEEPGGQVVYLESLWSAEYLDRDAQVQMYRDAFDRLNDAALDRKSTVGVIKKWQGELQ